MAGLDQDCGRIVAGLWQDCDKVWGSAVSGPGQSWHRIVLAVDVIKNMTDDGIGEQNSDTQFCALLQNQSKKKIDNVLLSRSMYEREHAVGTMDSQNRAQRICC